MGVRIPGEGRDTEEVRGRPVGEVDVDEISVVEAELLLVLRELSGFGEGANSFSPKPRGESDIFGVLFPSKYQGGRA